MLGDRRSKFSAVGAAVGMMRQASRVKASKRSSLRSPPGGLGASAEDAMGMACVVEDDSTPLLERADTASELSAGVSPAARSAGSAPSAHFDRGPSTSDGASMRQYEYSKPQPSTATSDESVGGSVGGSGGGSVGGSGGLPPGWHTCVDPTTGVQYIA
jgi:hypothetical protein